MFLHLSWLVHLIVRASMAIYGMRAYSSSRRGILPNRGMQGADNIVDTAPWRLRCSSFLILTCFLIGNCNIILKSELHRSLRVNLRGFLFSGLYVYDSIKPYSDYCYDLLPTSSPPYQNHIENVVMLHKAVIRAPGKGVETMALRRAPLLI